MEGNSFLFRRGPKVTYHRLAFSPDKHLLALCKSKNRIAIFDFRTHSLADVPCPYNPKGMAFSPDGSHLAAASLIKMVMYSRSKWKERRAMGLHALALAFSLDAGRIAVAQWYRILVLDLPPCGQPIVSVAVDSVFRNLSAINDRYVVGNDSRIVAANDDRIVVGDDPITGGQTSTVYGYN